MAIPRNSFPNYDVDEASYQSGLFCEPGSSLTRQEFVPECDINVLVERFGITGTMPQNPRLPEYGDFAEVFDFRTAQDGLIAAREAFDSLSAKVRDRFNQSPQALMEFMLDPANRDEAVALGLLDAPRAGPAAPPSSGSAPSGASDGSSAT